MKITAFPKCYLDAICVDKTMTVFDWIEQSRSLGAEGLERRPGRTATMTRWVAARPQILHRIPETVSFEHAALAEPIGVAYNALVG